jgi:hypothetical protein
VTTFHAALRSRSKESSLGVILSKRELTEERFRVLGSIHARSSVTRSASVKRWNGSGAGSPSWRKPASASSSASKNSAATGADGPAFGDQPSRRTTRCYSSDSYRKPPSRVSVTSWGACTKGFGVTSACVNGASGATVSEGVVDTEGLC